MSQRAFRVLCFGDSLTAGFYNQGYSFYPYANVLKEKIPNAEIDISGFSGWTTRQMLENTENENARDVVGKPWPGLNFSLKKKKYDLVVVLAGTNDLGHGFSSQDIATNLIRMYESVKELGSSKVLAIGIPDSGFQAYNVDAKRRRVDANQLLKNFADRSNGFVEFIECPVTYHPDHLELFERDALHLSKQGYQKLGECLSEKIMQLS